MLRAVPMVRVRIQVPGREAAGATHAIARLGLLHLIDVAHGRTDAAPAGSQELLAAHRSLRTRIARALERLGLEPPAIVGRTDEQPICDFDVERKRIEAELQPMEQAVDRAWTDHAAAAASRAHLEQLHARAETLDRGKVDVERLAALRLATARVAAAPEDSLASLSAFLAPAPHLIQTVDAPGREALAVIVVPASEQPRLEAAVRLTHVETLSLSLLSGTLEEKARAVLSARADEEAAARTLAALREAHGPALRALIARIETCVLLLQAQVRFGTTGRFVVISGWIPEEESEKLRAAVLAAAPSAVVDVERPEELAAAPTGIGRVPILHRNPLLFRPFQPLVQIYDTPSYGEVQPTAFFAVSFLLMFGLMFGDVGHGALLCAAGYYLFRYVPRYLDYGILLMEAGVASACFGFLYGSFLGIEGLLPVLWLEPARDLPAFMRTAIGLGVVLVTVGLVLNVVNSWRMGERASALFGMRGLFGAFLYWTVLALVARAMMPADLVVPGWLLGIVAGGAGVLIALRGPLIKRLRPPSPRPGGPPTARWLQVLEGSVELVDSLFTYFANTISFIRVAAFAAVHAGVFVAMFAVSDTLAQAKFGGVLSVAALVIGNVVMILLEGLTVSVQVLRLEYYEFFGKFFRGGGEMYRPLMLGPSERKEGGS